MAETHKITNLVKSGRDGNQFWISSMMLSCLHIFFPLIIPRVLLLFGYYMSSCVHMGWNRMQKNLRCKTANKQICGTHPIKDNSKFPDTLCTHRTFGKWVNFAIFLFWSSKPNIIQEEEKINNPKDGVFYSFLVWKITFFVLVIWGFSLPEI